jgi:hypothetical protein
MTPSVVAMGISDEGAKDGCVDIDVTNEDAVDIFRGLVKEVLLRLVLPLKDVFSDVVGLAENDKPVIEVVFVAELDVL